MKTLKVMIMMMMLITMIINIENLEALKDYLKGLITNKNRCQLWKMK